LFKKKDKSVKIIINVVEGGRSMKNNKEKIVFLAENHLEQVFRKVEWNVRVLVEISEVQNYMRLLLKDNYSLLESLENDLDIREFKKFIKSPQINDILVAFLYLLIKQNIIGIISKKKIYRDDVENFFVEAIEKYFKELSRTETIVAIKTYFDVLINICSSHLPDDLYSDSVIRKEGKIIGSSVIMHLLSEKNFYEKDIEQLEMRMKQAFVPRNLKYEETKRGYGKSLKQYYQNGFIYLLGEYKFNEFYIPPILIKGSGTQNIFLRRSFRIRRDKIDKIRNNWQNIFNADDIIYVVGGAGYGKSLFLRNIINNYAKLNIENSQDYLLIYCDLKAYFNGDVSKKTMIDFFQESMISISGIEGISKEFINYYLKIGRCMFLLDALDEVPKSVRKKLHRKIMAFFATCNPDNKVCITSRDRGFLPEQDIEVLEIIPLTERDIDDYLEKMIDLKKFKREDKKTFMKQAQVLIEKEFLNNFLILSLLVNIYKSERELPENKIDLYKKCFEYIAKKREEEKSKTGYNWKNIYPLMKDSTFIKLSTLAAPNNTDISREKVEELLLKLYRTKYSDEAEAECAIKEFLDFCSNRTELFVPASVDDKFKFFHRSFFEYFYSRYIYQQPKISVMYELMAKFDVDSEVFELTVALVKEDNEEKYQQLIEYILKKVAEEFSLSEPSGTAFGILTLAMQVVDDAYYIQKYYDIIINYNRIMSSNKIGNMNQRLISMWVEKEISGDDKKIDQFLKTFSVQCARYLLMLLSAIDNSRFRELHSVKLGHIQEFDSLDKMSINIQSSRGSIPFYVFIFSQYGRLYDLMEKCINKGFGAISKGNVKKSELKKGFYNYKQLSQEERKQYLSFLQKNFQI